MSAETQTKNNQVVGEDDLFSQVDDVVMYRKYSVKMQHKLRECFAQK